MKVKARIYNLENKANEVIALFEIINELKLEEESIIRDLRIADILIRLETLLGA